jgi:hypothetical protein
MPGWVLLAGSTHFPSAKGFSMISKFAGLEIPVDKPARMTLIHPVTRQPLRDRKSKDKEGQVAYIELHSTDSDAFRRHLREVNRRKSLPQGRVATTTPEQDEAEALEILAALTTGWYLVGLDGEHIDVPFNTENAKDLYAATSLAWIREQVNAFAVERANFAKASSLN